jgi:hypothetical protein
MSHIEWTHRIDGQSESDIAYEARAVLKTMSGQVIGAAENMAAMSENKPWSKSLFSIRSMAETRAVGKAFRLNFGWIMKLAGYDAVPVEEMTASSQPAKITPETSTAATADNLNLKVETMDPNSPTVTATQPSSDKASPAQVGLDAAAAKDYIKGIAKVEHLNELTKDVAALTINELQLQAADYQKPQTSQEKVKAKVADYQKRGTAKVQDQSDSDLEKAVEEVF